MSRRVRSRTTYKRLKPIFSTSDAEFGPLIARLTVLYEDLRIEVAGLSERGFDSMDVTSAQYRRLYFLRRSMITLVEFRATLQRLSENSAFRALRAHFDDECEQRLSRAETFFGQHHAVLKAIRNDCGGHFQLRTANSVVHEHLHDETTGAMEVDFGRLGDRVEIHLRFAVEFVGSSVVLQQPKGVELDSFVKELFQTIREGWMHVVAVVHVLIKSYLAPAFGL